MNKTTRTAVSVLFFTLTACAVSRVDPLSIPLVYSANPKSIPVYGTLSCNVISQAQVSDARTDRSVIGIRTHESKPLQASVTSATDPAMWVQSGLHSALAEAGITPQGRGPRLAVSLDSLRTTESIWHRSSYTANLVLSGWLVAPSGRVCWRQTAQGTGENYGYAGSIVDYQETLNAALDKASVNLVQAAGFKDALCQCAD